MTDKGLKLFEAVGPARVFDLEQLRYAGAPSHPAHQPGFNYFLHRQHAPGATEPRTGASGLVVMPEHSGTHIDALAHQAENLTLHGGVNVDGGVQTSAGFRILGVETMAPLVARGVLLDMLGRATADGVVALSVASEPPFLDTLLVREHGRQSFRPRGFDDQPRLAQYHRV